LGGRYGPTCIQNQIVDRPDVLSYSTEPLEKSLEATGKISLTVSMSSDRPDTDLIAKLIDVYPNGYAMNLAEGQIRASYRGGDDKVSPLEASKIYKLNIHLGSISHLFGQGHRIRLDISSTSFPKLEPNPGTGEPHGSWTRRVKARNTIYHDGSNPSKLTLMATGN
jgi:putative CocE/NonD family hydrolase